MDDVFGFDDGLFLEEEKVCRTDEQQFIAHYADPAWFLQTSPSKEDDTCSKKLPTKCKSGDEVSVLKFQGDYYYLGKDLETAIKHYQKTLELLPGNNVVTRRECYENIARCSIKIANYCVALHYSSLLHRSSKTVEQLTVSLSCLVDVCIHSGLMEQAALPCMKLITIHKLNSHGWLKLAYILGGLFNVDLPHVRKMVKIHKNLDSHTCNCDSENCLAREKCDLNSIIQVQNRTMLVLFCVMMSRYVLSSIQGTAVGFAAETIATQLSHLDEDMGILTSEMPQHEQQLDFIVTKLVFGYIKGLKVDCSQGEDFEDRGSSKFVPSEEIEVNFDHVVSVTCENFAEKWFKDFLNLSSIQPPK